MEKRLRGLKPILGRSPKLLLLGSMPSPESIRKQEYYAFPQNQFWRLMAGLVREPRPDTYARKVRLLTGHGIALWDTIDSCRRKNARDSEIRDAVPNDIVGVLSRFPGIRAIALNGLTAEKMLLKFHRIDPRVAVECLPSSSPANAFLSFAQKLRRWSVLEKWL